MKRKRRKTVHYLTTALPKTAAPTFPKGTTSLWLYNQAQYSNREVEDLSALQFKDYPDEVMWLNDYGLQHADISSTILPNGLDEFLLHLMTEVNHRNKVIELDACFFFSLKAPALTPDAHLVFEQLFFVVSKSDAYIWTLQELEGDHFDHIRARIAKNAGMVRKKSSDYLFYLLIEATVDNFYRSYERLSEDNKRL